MKFAHHLAHLFIPRESNNQKARLLHPSRLILLIGFLVFYQVFLDILPRVGPRILGYAANIAPSEVIRLTNQKRAEAGLTPLTENSTLSQAAQAKGADMLNKGYWAHVAPDGTQPWKFFTDFGYKYRYAGENLARDFSNPQSAIEAWMASPSHKENLMSSKYKEIGIAVVEGNLAGVDSTIIVQFFGTKYADTAPSLVASAKEPAASASAETKEPPKTAAIVATPQPSITVPNQVETTTVNLAGTSAIPKSYFPLVSPFASTKNIAIFVVILLLGVLGIDGVIVARRKIARISGRSFAHLAFLSMILIIVLILKSGKIL